MKKNLILAALLLLFVAPMSARPKTRGVVIDTVANCHISSMHATISRFCYEFQADPDRLFSWAYLNTGSESPSDEPKPELTEEEKQRLEEEKKKNESKEGKDALRLVYKDRTYDPETYTGDVAIDIYVLGSRMFKDNHLGTIYGATMLTDHSEIQQLNATYSGSILEGGQILFRLDSIGPNQTEVHYDFNLTFGRFLATFISDKTWNNVAAWRFNNILGNLIEYAETGKVTDRSKKK